MPFFLVVKCFQLCNIQIWSISLHRRRLMQKILLQKFVSFFFELFTSPGRQDLQNWRESDLARFCGAGDHCVTIQLALVTTLIQNFVFVYIILF